MEFYLKQAPEIVSNVGYVPLPEEGYQREFDEIKRIEIHA